LENKNNKSKTNMWLYFGTKPQKTHQTEWKETKWNGMEWNGRELNLSKVQQTLSMIHSLLLFLPLL
jgi:hypothetical protein